MKCALTSRLLLGLARLLPVLYKPVLLLHLLPVVLPRQKLLFGEERSIKLLHLLAHDTKARNNLVRRRTVWTTSWLLRKASIDLKILLPNTLWTRLHGGYIESFPFVVLSRLTELQIFSPSHRVECRATKRFGSCCDLEASRRVVIIQHETHDGINGSSTPY